MCVCMFFLCFFWSGGGGLWNVPWLLFVIWKQGTFMMFPLTNLWETRVVNANKLEKRFQCGQDLNDG